MPASSTASTGRLSSPFPLHTCASCAHWGAIIPVESHSDGILSRVCAFHYAYTRGSDKCLNFTPRTEGNPLHV